MRIFKYSLKYEKSLLLKGVFRFCRMKGALYSKLCKGNKSNKVIRWGIMGSGYQAKVIAKGIIDSSNGHLKGFASRKLENAMEAACGFDCDYYESYDAMLKDDEIDAVFVVVPNQAHKDCVIQALRNKKAVVCEKPFALSADELEEMMRVSIEEKAFLMEGMWTLCLPIMRRLKKIIQTGIIGEVRMVSVNFCYSVPKQVLDSSDHRLTDPQKGGGSLLDVGVYTIAFSDFIFSEHPINIVSNIAKAASGVDRHGQISLMYSGGKSAGVSFGIDCCSSSDAYIFGEKGHIHIPEFWKADRIEVSPSGLKSYCECIVDAHSKYRFEIEEAGACILCGKLNSDYLTLDNSLAVMNTMDKIRKQWSIKYPQDDNLLDAL